MKERETENASSLPINLTGGILLFFVISFRKIFKIKVLKRSKTNSKVCHAFQKSKNYKCRRR